jgi:hypothetical protein
MKALVGSKGKRQTGGLVGNVCSLFRSATDAKECVPRFNKTRSAFRVFIAVVACAATAGTVLGRGGRVHSHIYTTVFWIGEQGSLDNDYIPNDKSTWDENWETNFGGVDDPDHRRGFEPAEFEPLQNPFYCALPYSDFDDNGRRKSSAASVVFWHDSRKWAPGQSMCKNHWVRIVFEGREAYAQWEDAGPFGEDDVKYVFGTAVPRKHAGLDVSPAVRDYLGLQGAGFTQWEFVDSSKVPNGPWKKTVTHE